MITWTNQLITQTMSMLSGVHVFTLKHFKIWIIFTSMLSDWTCPCYQLFSLVQLLVGRQAAEHKNGPQCQCTECGKLLKTENKWILRLGTFYGSSGLKSRDQIKSNVIVNYRMQGRCILLTMKFCQHSLEISFVGLSATLTFIFSN